MLAGAAETAGAPLRGAEIFDDVELRLYDRNDDELREALERVQREGRRAPVPGRYHQLALVVGVDQTDQVAQHDAVLVPSPERGRISAA